jgi:hypothetical protein
VFIKLGIPVLQKTKQSLNVRDGLVLSQQRIVQSFGSNWHKDKHTSGYVTTVQNSSWLEIICNGKCNYR